MQVHHIIFIVWAIVFVGWAAKQFSEHNKRNERDVNNDG